LTAQTSAEYLQVSIQVTDGDTHNHTNKNTVPFYHKAMLRWCDKLRLSSRPRILYGSLHKLG